MSCLIAVRPFSVETPTREVNRPTSGLTARQRRGQVWQRELVVVLLDPGDHAPRERLEGPVLLADGYVEESSHVQLAVRQLAEQQSLSAEALVGVADDVVGGARRPNTLSPRCRTRNDGQVEDPVLASDLLDLRPHPGALFEELDKESVCDHPVALQYSRGAVRKQLVGNCLG